jgi:hypothetical protein
LKELIYDYGHPDFVSSKKNTFQLSQKGKETICGNQKVHGTTSFDEKIEQPLLVI